MHRCTRCHETRQCSVFTRRTNKDGSVYVRYICPPCRMARYRLNHPVVRRSRQQVNLDKVPKHYNYGLKLDRPVPPARVTPPYYEPVSASLSQLLAEGRRKNLSIMLKYAQKTG